MLFLVTEKKKELSWKREIIIMLYLSDPNELIKS